MMSLGSCTAYLGRALVNVFVGLATMLRVLCDQIRRGLMRRIGELHAFWHWPFLDRDLLGPVEDDGFHCGRKCRHDSCDLGRHSGCTCVSCLEISELDG
jgi:hypothetical protein